MRILTTFQMVITYHSFLGDLLLVPRVKRLIHFDPFVRYLPHQISSDLIDLNSTSPTSFERSLTKDLDHGIYYIKERKRQAKLYTKIQFASMREQK